MFHLLSSRILAFFHHMVLTRVVLDPVHTFGKHRNVFGTSTIDSQHKNIRISGYFAISFAKK